MGLRARELIRGGVVRAHRIAEHTDLVEPALFGEDGDMPVIASAACQNKKTSALKLV